MWMNRTPQRSDHSTLGPIAKLRPLMEAKRIFGSQIKRLPYLRELVRDRERLEELNQRLWVPLGHFNSPLPSLQEVHRRVPRIFQTSPRDLAPIQLNEEEQLELIKELARYYPDQPFQPTKTEGLRYFFDNVFYGYTDSLLFYCMIRHLRPQRVIEIGSGYSSCVLLDTNELHFGNAIHCTFIDPNPDQLLSLIYPKDASRIHLIREQVQDVDKSLFSELEPGDMLFVDSSHVSKAGSDVNHILFEILPALRRGVWVHFHDIFYPFEYPLEWLMEGRAWTEAYLLRAFLQYNQVFQIALFAHYLFRFHSDLLFSLMPLCAKGAGGCLWLRKIS